MTPDIKLKNDVVIVEANLTIGTEEPARPLHVATGEIHSGGNAGGFSFATRSKGNEPFPEELGERWVLYADKNFAHLWTSGFGDLFSVSTTGQAFVRGMTGGFSFTDPQVYAFVNLVRLVPDIGRITQSTERGEFQDRADVLDDGHYGRDGNIGTHKVCQRDPRQFAIKA